MSRWRTMSGAEREREYSPSSCLPDGDYGPFVVEYRRRSDASWSAVEAHPDVVTTTVPYGDAASHTVDVAVPTGGAPGPLIVFVHGGYWQELSKLESRFAAADCVGRGRAFAAVDYTLAPHATLDEIVDECRRAVRALSVEADGLGVDASRIVVAGSSAGAHLAAMMATDPDRPSGVPAGLVLVSGVFELEPLIGTSVNDAVGLDRIAALRNSPLLLDVAGFPPTVLAVGSDETSEFAAQTDAFARHLVAAGVRTSVLEVDGRNHFDVVLDLGDPSTTLGRAVDELVRALR